jgi:YD repeat-containing protein
VTATQTNTNTVTQSGTGTANVTQTVTATATATTTQTATVTQTRTHTATATATRTGSAPGIYQQIYTFTGTVTSTGTAIVYYTSWPHAQGNTATATSSQFASGTSVVTVTRTVTSPFNSTETKTASATVSGSGTNTGTATVTVTATVTTSTTNAGTGTRTVTATGIATGTAIQTWTATWTTQVTQTVTNTTTSTLSDTNTTTNTLTVTNTNTYTQTSTRTQTGSSTNTITSTSTATATGTKTTTSTTATDTETITATVTVTNTGTSDGGKNACLIDWRSTTCGHSCTGETQPDRAACWEFLDCYYNNACSPASCGEKDQICGVNKVYPANGMVPKTIADQVYACLGCPSVVTPSATCEGRGDGTLCDDKDACTQVDICIQGKCQGTNPKDCGTADQCHLVGTCNSTTGECTSHPLDGPACDDGNSCTKNDTCKNGVCGGTTYSCNDGPACTTGACNGDGTCTNSLLPHYCLIDNVCYANAAVNPGNQCQICDSTQPATWSPQQEGATCNDGDACTSNDVCNGSGVCSGTPYACDHPLDCAADVCNGDGTCGLVAQAGFCVIDSNCYANADKNPDNQCQFCDSTKPSTWSTVTCGGGDACHTARTCDASKGECSDPAPIDKIGCNINLRVDGVVNTGGNNWIAIFGWDSTATGQFHPTSNTVSVDSGVVPATSPPPPAYLIPGIHPGSFLAQFTTGQKITWTVDTQSVDAYSDSRSTILTYTPVGTSGGKTVEIQGGTGGTGGTQITITPDMGEYSKAPDEPTPADEPELGDPFKGMLTGSLSVGPTGAALYSVPISIPPGIAGMAPNLSLVYNSQGGPGIAGLGWDMTGLSTIQRCQKTFTQDGYTLAVKMSTIGFESQAGDGVCLDGKRLLVDKVEGSGHTVTFVTEYQDFSTTSANFNGYDAGSRQTNYTFKVVTKSGETRYYGSRKNARVYLPMEDDNGIKATGETVPAVWALDMVVDPWGNFYEIHYNDDLDTDSDFQDRGLIVTSIDYTGHMDLLTGEVDVQPFNHIRFAYHDRTDVRNQRFRDSVLPMKKRLLSITAYLGDSQGQTYGLIYEKPIAPYRPMDPDTLTAIAIVAKPGTNGPNCLDPQVVYSTNPSTTEKCAKPLMFTWKTFDPGSETWWNDNSEYALPAIFSGAGTQFVDIDGDGLVDFVEAPWGLELSKVWKNSGHGWDKMDSWALPPGVTMTNSTNGNVNGTRFMDVDGDGLLDLIRDNGCVGYNPNCDLPKVWLNKSRSSSVGASIWIEQTGGLAGSHLGLMDLSPGSAYNAQAGDLDGDGLLELMGTWCDNYGTAKVIIYRTDGSAWHTYTQDFDIMKREGCQPLILRDVDQDGLADLVTNDGSTIYYNKGFKWDANNFNPFWSSPVAYHGIDKKYLVATADVDGDKHRDQIFVSTSEGNGWAHANYNASDVSFNSGSGIASSGADGYADALNIYSFSLADWNLALGNSELGRFQVADLNGDGLADVVINHSWGGALLINKNSTFTDIDNISNHPRWRLGAPPDSNYPFVDSAPTNSRWIVPQALPPGSIKPIRDNQYSYPLDYFMDINGDGIVDRVQSLMQCDPAESSCTTPYVKKTYLNQYHPPVITDFPNGLAESTTVTYSVITKGDSNLYTDLASLATGTMYAAIPMRVVSSMSVDNGVGSKLTSSYAYSSLRMSANGHGSLGFKEILVTDPQLFVTDTTYSQSYPSQGMPLTVTRSKSGFLTTSNTVTSYSVVSNSQHSIFIRPDTVTDTSYLYSSPTNGVPIHVVDAMTTTTSFTFDDYGNAKTTTVTNTSGEHATCDTGGNGDAGASSGSGATSGTCESYQHKVENFYGDADSAEQKRGKVTEVIVTSTKLAPQTAGGNPPIVHTTDFEYSQDSLLKLVKKKVEPNGVVGIRLDTAYDYDGFGNVITTTTCASDFDSCTAGESNPGDTSKPEHPAFRTTTISYKPKDFAPGSGAPTASLSYSEEGRFPVKTTNATGQVEYSVYNPELGVLIQSTGPNGIHTCYTYDDFGWKTSETARCGSEVPLMTTTDRFWTGSSDSDWAKLVTVTRRPSKTLAPSHDATWVYTDGLGRTVETLGRSLEGGFTETQTEYNSLGQTKRTSKPHFPGDTTIYWSTPVYDTLERVSDVTQDLGAIDGTSTDGSSTGASSGKKTIYAGMSTSTSTIVNGQTQTRTEQKNVLGKVSSVIDANGIQISYTYDAEGNLTDTNKDDQSGNTLHIDYDARGRKWKSNDPDLGKWTYAYNGFGDLLTQTDAKGQITTLTYDVLGRMITKTGAAGTATWVYDVASVAGIGKLAAVIGAPDQNLDKPCTAPSLVPTTVPTSGNRAMRWMAYNALGELVESSECTDGDTFTTQYDYDITGRQSAIRYPEVQGSRFSVKYNYTSLGFLQSISDAADEKIYWEGESLRMLLAK